MFKVIKRRIVGILVEMFSGLFVNIIIGRISRNL